MIGDKAMIGDEKKGTLPVVPGLGLRASRLVARLKDGQRGDVLSDEELTAICGWETGVKGRGYPSLLSAIRYVRRNYGIVWKRAMGEGCIKCLPDDERIDYMRQLRRQSAKSARVGLQVAVSVDLQGLQGADVTRYHANSAALGMMELAGRAKTVSRLEKQGATNSPDLQALLAAFPRYPKENQNES